MLFFPEIFAINNVIRPNIAVSSPSPNSVIQTVNHSNYFCSTPEKEKSNHIYNIRQTQNEDPENHNKYNRHLKKPDEDYENCNKAVTDLFTDKQKKNNMSPQNRNMPFKKIVVVEEKYESLKQTNAEMRTVRNCENANNNQFGQIDKQSYSGMNINYRNANRQAGFYVENINPEDRYNNLKNIINQNQQTCNKADSSFAYNKSDMDMSQHYSVPTSHNFKQPSSDTMYDMRRKSYCVTKSQLIDTLSYEAQKQKSNDGYSNQQNFNQNAEENDFNNTPTNKISKELHVRTQTIYLNQSQSYRVKDRYGGSNLKQDSNFDRQIHQPNVSSMHQLNSTSQEDVSSQQEYGLNEGQMKYLQRKESMMQGCSRPSSESE